MKHLILILALTTAAFAQDPPKAMVQKIFELKYVEPGEVKQLLGALEASISPVNNLRMIAVRGSKETVEVIEEALKRIDVPRPAKKNVEFTGYMILASSKSADTTESPELAPVIKQLRGLFPYKGYRVVETLFLRARDGDNGNASGYIVDSLNGNRHSYKFSFSTAALTADRQIRMNNVSLEVNTPSGILGFRTQLDIREGQKVVVGKSNVVGTDDALILVLNAKVIE
jgi:hypothetical protein